MSRLSNNEIIDGHLKNGFDYDFQLWVLNYIIQDCGHPDDFDCHCNGRRLKGQDIREVIK